MTLTVEQLDIWKKEITETLETRHKNELRGILNKLIQSIELEINEADICLDREEPNIKMALNRLTSIQEILNKHK